MEAAKQCINDYQGPLGTRRMLMQVLLHLLDDDKEAAIAAFDASKELPGRNGWRIGAAMATGQFDWAGAEYEQEYPGWFAGETLMKVDSWSIDDAINVAIILQHRGDHAKAENLLEAALDSMKGLKRNYGGESFGLADIEAYAVLGRTEQALAALEEVADLEYLSDWQSLKFLPHYSSIRDDPRFRSALNRLSAAADAASDRAMEEGLL
jgi:tetratricopeptide (TPR) repeat protein